MAKYFVTLAHNCNKYKVSKEDIKRVYSAKIKKAPRIPAFDRCEKDSSYESDTSCDDSECLFEPVQFFPINLQRDY